MFKRIVWFGLMIVGCLLLGSGFEGGPNITDGLVAYYPLNGNGLDSSSNGNHAAAFGAILPCDDRYGNPNSALFFDHMDDYLEATLTNGPELVNVELGGYNTVVFWMKPAVGLYGPSVPFAWREYILELDDEPSWSGSGFGFNSHNNDSYGIPISEVRPYYGQWIHVAGIFKNGDAENSELYINGVKQVLSRLYNPPNNNHAVATSQIQIGDIFPHGYSWNYHFTGMLDELRIFNRALSGDEVLSLFNRNDNDKTPPDTAMALNGTVGLEGWFISPVTVELNATDPVPGSDIKEIHFQLDNGPEMILSGNAASYRIATDGIHTMRYYAIDNAENRELPRTETVRIDTAAPIPDMTPLPTLNGECSAFVRLFPSATDNLSGQVFGTTTDPLRYDSQGTFKITWSYADGHGNVSTQMQTVIVKDTIPPVVSNLFASPSEIWPPNHKMIPVAISVTATDNCTALPQSEIVKVTCNEPVNGPGDGNTDPDWLLTGKLSLNVRSERSGTGNGRVYTITVACMDAVGNSALKDVTVTVPKSKGK
jgi:hypothetical protein